MAAVWEDYYVGGDSTQVDDVVQARGMSQISKNQTSSRCQSLNVEIKRFRSRRRENLSETRTSTALFGSLRSDLLQGGVALDLGE